MVRYVTPDYPFLQSIIGTLNYMAYASTISIYSLVCEADLRGSTKMKIIENIIKSDELRNKKLEKKYGKSNRNLLFWGVINLMNSLR